MPQRLPSDIAFLLKEAETGRLLCRLEVIYQSDYGHINFKRQHSCGTFSETGQTISHSRILKMSCLYPQNDFIF